MVKLIPFEDANEDIQNIARLSAAVRKNAYCPYSNFAVGVALICEDGQTYDGCNVENSSYGITVCAEQTAICKAVSSGNKNIKAVVVCADKDKTFPCGKCRQFIFEFGSEIDIYSVKPDLKEIYVTSVAELLSYGFHLQRDK